MKRFRFLKEVSVGQVVSFFSKSTHSFYKNVRVLENDDGILYGINRDTKRHVNIFWNENILDIILIKDVKKNFIRKN